LFLQLGGWYLYKAELVMCSYSTWTSDNAVEMPATRCPKGSSGGALLFVSRRLFRITKLHSSFRDQNAARGTKSNQQTSTRPSVKFFYRKVTELSFATGYRVYCASK